MSVLLQSEVDELAVLATQSLVSDKPQTIGRGYSQFIGRKAGKEPYCVIAIEDDIITMYVANPEAEIEWEYKDVGADMNPSMVCHLRYNRENKTYSEGKYPYLIRSHLARVVLLVEKMKVI